MMTAATGFPSGSLHSGKKKTPNLVSTLGLAIVWFSWYSLAVYYMYIV